MTARFSKTSLGNVTRRTPDLSQGLCVITRKGQEIAERAFREGTSIQATAARTRAKLQCAACPLLAECLAWVTEQESPAGSWRGVYGGKDPWDRRGKTPHNTRARNYVTKRGGAPC